MSINHDQDAVRTVKNKDVKVNGQTQFVSRISGLPYTTAVLKDLCAMDEGQIWCTVIWKLSAAGKGILYTQY